MKLSLRACVLPVVLPAVVASCGVMNSQAQNVTEIGGQKIVTLTRTATSKTKPEFTSVTVLPGRGMEVLQITANFPGKGNVDVLASPSLAEAKKMLDRAGHTERRSGLSARLGLPRSLSQPHPRHALRRRQNPDHLVAGTHHHPSRQQHRQGSPAPSATPCTASS